jgi:hypothetical protein
MHKFGLGLMAAAAVLLAAGSASADPMQAYYGNTVKITYPSGAVASFLLDQGGTYSLKLPDGTTGTGVWTMEGDQFCTTRMTPAPQPKQCRPGTERNVGDTWEEDTPNGKVKYELVAGR